MSISHFFEGGKAVVELRSTDKMAAFCELIGNAPVFQEVTDRTALEHAVIEREKNQCTGLGHGVAVAHGRLDSMHRVIVGLGISHTGISYGSPDESPVHLLFLIASPTSMNLDYLQTLSTLVRIVHDPALREELLALRSTGDVERRIRDSFQRLLGRFSSTTPSATACGTAR